MPSFSQKDLDKMPKRFRANFVNALSGVKSANIVGSISTNKTPNAALFSSAFHLGADPALMGLVSRPNSVPRHTLENIQSTGSYTINHVNMDIFKAAHLTSARTSENEFHKSGLTSEYLPNFSAPFVLESHIKIGLELVRIIDIEENGTHIIIGNITRVIMDNDYVESNGDIDLNAAGSVGVSGLFTYHSLCKLDKLPHVRGDY